MPSELNEVTRDKVPPGLLERIDNPIIESGIEHTLHGPIAKLLSTIFSGPNWLVDPQVLLYNSTLAAAQRDDSYGTTKAKGTRATFADFVVCIYGHSACDDVPYLVLNIKRENVSIAAELARLDRYLEKLDAKIRVPGLLVVDNMVGKIQCTQGVNEHGEPIKELGLKNLIKISSKEFLDYLRDIASSST